MISIPKMASMAVTGLDLAEHTSPLQWWRGPQSLSLDERGAATLRALLSRVAFLENPDWRLAVEGDTARAVRIALHAAANHRRLWNIDYAASALLLCAAGGDPAALATLTHLRHRFAIPRHIALGEV